MRMKRNSFVVIAIGFLIMAFISGYIYHRGKHRHPFRYDLDLTTLTEWMDDLVEKGQDHFSVDFLTKGPYDFTNDNDLGGDSLSWSKKEDEYFIVYYSKAMDPRIGSYRANNCLEVAHDAIPDLVRTMGRYYYPKDVMDNRKLTIYLPDSPASYIRIINELSGHPVNSSGSIGMTLAVVTQCGPSVTGIVIHPSCFDPDVYELNDYRVTLRHEMSHYVYFMALDYSVDVDHPLWVSEGIADFIGRAQQQVSGADSIQFIAGKCKLDEDFPDDSRMPNSSYWAGESFYKFLSDTCGVDYPSKFIGLLYDTPVPEGLAVLFPDTDPKEKWLESLRQSDTLRHPEYLVKDNIRPNH